MNNSVIAEGEVARVYGHKLIFEGGRALPDDTGGFTDGGYILADFAFLNELSVSADLVVTRHGCRVGNIHQLVGALVGEFEMFGHYYFAAVIAGLRSGFSEECGGWQSCQRQGGQDDYHSLHVLLLSQDCCPVKISGLECWLEQGGIIGEASSRSLQPGAQLFLNHFSTAK